MEQLDTNTRLADVYETHINGQQVDIKEMLKIGHVEKLEEGI